MASPATAVTGAGLAFALLSMVANGTFAIFGKFCKPPPDDVLFSTWTSVGVFLSSVVAVLLAPTDESGQHEFGWSWPGALGGILLVVAILFSFIAVTLSGLATAQATWSCAAIVVSILWGVLGPRRDGAGPGAPVKDVGLTVLAVVMLVAGVLIINLKDRLKTRSQKEGKSERELEAGAQPTEEDGREDGPEAECSADAPSSEEAEGDTASSSSDDGRKGSAGGRASALVGLVPALLVGASGGSVLVPMSFVEPRLQGLPALLSFGVAGAVAGIAVGLGYWAFVRKASFSLAPGSPLRQELRLPVVLLGMVSGVVWNLGNICQIVAMSQYRMPYGISYPILQCAFIVGGLWGIFVFKEVTDPLRIVVFFVGVAVVAAGVILLGASGPGAK